MNPIDEVQEEAARKFDPREADALYKAFPSFTEWSANCVVDSKRWERYAENINELRNKSPDLLPRALEVVKRAAAWDTGAIEGLYETDRGFTLTVARQVATLETLAEQKGEEARALFESQLNAYDYVLDFATKRIPIGEAWIRELHRVVCESQGTYEVQTAIGTQRHPLPKREYKRNPNHVVQRDGSIHAWAPVDLTPQEMHRLCEELRSEDFTAGHPIMQAAYAHYAFVSVHPFADGNGRVARALASVFTYRAESIPLLILKGDVAYLPALESADRGAFQRFVDFILEKAIDTVRLTEDSLRAAVLPPLEAALADLKGLYVTRGGYTHAEVDEAGYTFFELFRQEITKHLEVVRDTSSVSFRLSDASISSPRLAKETSRWPVAKGKRELDVRISSPAPANATVHRVFLLEVPKDCGREDDFIIHDREARELIEARITELLPRPTTALEVRLKVVAEAIVNKLIRELTSRAFTSRRQKGY